MTDATPPHQRRVRYAGTHPRSFAEKYKELDPLSHAEAIDKVMARGQTPAGMHRPICVAEILALLAPQPGEVGLDATLGYGGHARELLARLSPGGGCLGLMSTQQSLPAPRRACAGWASTPRHWSCTASILTAWPRCCPKLAAALT